MKAFSLRIRKFEKITLPKQNKKENYYNKVEKNLPLVDKIPPEIIGIEDGQTYNREININYKDNVGIQNIKVFKINNNEQLEKNPYKLKEDGLYKIIVEDLAGNRNEKIIRIKKPYNINYKSDQ